MACIGGEIYLQWDPETYKLLPNELGKPIRCVNSLEKTPIPDEKKQD